MQLKIFHPESCHSLLFPFHHLHLAQVMPAQDTNQSPQTEVVGYKVPSDSGNQFETHTNYKIKGVIIYTV